MVQSISPKNKARNLRKLMKLRERECVCVFASLPTWILVAAAAVAEDDEPPKNPAPTHPLLLLHPPHCFEFLKSALGLRRRGHRRRSEFVGEEEGSG